MLSFRTLALSAVVALASFTAAAPINTPPAVRSIPETPSLLGVPAAHHIPGVVVPSAPKVLDTPPTPAPRNLRNLIAHVGSQVNDIKAQLGMFLFARLCAAIIPDGARRL